MRMLDVAQTAERLGVSKEYVRVLVSRGAIQHTRSGRRITFLEDDVERYDRDRQKRREAADQRLLLRGNAWAQELSVRKDSDGRVGKALKYVQQALAVLQSDRV